MRVLFLFVVMFCVCAPTTRAVTCLRCAEMLKEIGQYCEVPRRGSYNSYCRTAGVPREQADACQRVTDGLRDHAKFMLDTLDPCKAVDNIQAPEHLQDRLLICCGPLLRCDPSDHGFARQICYDQQVANLLVNNDE